MNDPKDLKPEAADDRESEINELNQAGDAAEAEIEYREEDLVLDERAMREDLTQGMDTGTHDFIHRGANWPPSYRNLRKKAN